MFASIRTFLALMLVSLLSVGVHAQTLVAYDSNPNLIVETPAVSPAFPAGGGPLVQFGLPVPLPPTGPLLGAVAMDNTTGILWVSSGFSIEAMNHVSYPPLAPVPPPGIWPWAPPPPLAPNIHGMTMDPLGGGGFGPALWVTDGAFMVPMGVPPFGPVGPIIPLDRAVGGPIPVRAPPLTGIDWDPITGTFWAVDTVGFTYNFVPFGFLGMGPPPPPGPAPALGVAVDRTGGTILAPALYIAFPGVVMEAFSGGLPIPLPSLNQGLSFHAVPATLPGASPCASGLVPAFTPNGPAFTGNVGFAVTLAGVPPGAPIAMMLDAAVIPGGMAFGQGSLYLDPFFSPSFQLIPFGPAPLGPLTMPASLGGIPVGTVLYAQWAVGCGPPSSPVALSDGLQLIVSFP